MFVAPLLSIATGAVAFLSGSSSAAPIGDRDVGVLTCKKVASGVLKYNKIGAGAHPLGNAAFNGNRDGQGLQILVTRDGLQPVPGESFDFVACTSNKAQSFMEFPTEQTSDGTNTYFGHIQPSKTPSRCISAVSLGDKDGHFAADKCTYSDDSGQLFQYWSYADGYLQFLGQRKSDYQTGTYNVGIGNTANKKVALYYNHPARPTDEKYFLSLS